MYNNMKRLISIRESAIVDLLARGFSDKEIAERLKISISTVCNHLRNIHAKLHVTKNSEVILAYIAFLNGHPFDLKDVRERGVRTIL